MNNDKKVQSGYIPKTKKRNIVIKICSLFKKKKKANLSYLKDWAES